MCDYQLTYRKEPPKSVGINKRFYDCLFDSLWEPHKGVLLEERQALAATSCVKN